MTQGLFAKVDIGDYDALNRWKWHATKGADDSFYAARVFSLNGRKGPRFNIKMHRSIMGAGPDEVVDHRNGDTLNNCRYNLRRCTQVQNMYNTVSRVGSSQFKGVAWHKKARKWRAYIMVNRHHIHLGLFVDEHDAARAYDAAALLHFGEYARLNFPLFSAA